MYRMIMASISALCLFGLSGCKPGVYFSFKPHAQQEAQEQALTQAQLREQQKQRNRSASNAN